MTSYLVTGAAGFIGARVSELLLEAGHTVLGIDDLSDAYDQRLKSWRLDRLLSQPGFEFRQLDIVDRASLEEAWEGRTFDGVINLAARAGVRASVADPWIYLRTNAQGALNLLDLAQRRAVPKFVQASTSSLYGADNPRPFREDADTSRPLSPYAASKGAAELLCHTYHSLHGLDISVLRYFTVYGPAGRPDMSIFRFVQWIAEGRPVRLFGDGRQERDFTFVDDIALGTIKALQPVGFEIINLGGDHPFSLLQVIHSIEGLLGQRAIIEHHPVAPADVQATWADIRRAGELLGWEPRTSLDQGLSACVDWYLAQRSWASQVDTSG
jgi:UDP-glucuronate 4-epimerase